ncbi:WXG100 family type VII secretion target [Streptomyces sp. NPDC002520]
MTHEQLAAMLDTASTAGASHLSSKLSKAASTITKIGDDLMKHVKGLEWQGEGGDAFRDWGGQTASATLRLGEYAAVASRWMGTVSQGIAEAKAAMPDVSETTQAEKDLINAHDTIAATKQPGAHNDPDAQQLARTARTDAATAQQRMDAARGEAIQQMRKLAQTYEYSAQQVSSVTPPTFSPPAKHMDSRDWVGSSQYVPAGSGGYVATSRTDLGPSGGATAQHGTPHVVRQVATERVTPDVTNRHVHPSQPASLDLDGVDTLPESTTPTRTPPTVVPHQDVPVQGQPTSVPPIFTGGDRGPSATSRPRFPTQPQVPQMTAPRGITTGQAPRLPRETGITGGRPVTSVPGRPQNGIPRGTVIGNESTQGRTGMARGVTTGAPVEGGASYTKGPASGRRLTSETGGVVGSRPMQQGRGRARPFTPGGSGLVRPAPNTAEGSRAVVGRTGTTANPGQPSDSRKDQQRGQRPYDLVEGEET